MEHPIFAGLLQPLQPFIPERREPPVKYKHIQSQVNTQITADHVQHIRIAPMAVEKHQFFESAGGNGGGNVMKQGIIGLRPEGNRPREAHMLIAFPYIQLRGKNKVSRVEFTLLYHFIHQGGKDNSIRSYRQMGAVLLRSGSRQQDNGLVLIQRRDFISCQVLPFLNHTSSVLLPPAACFC